MIHVLNIETSSDRCSISISSDHSCTYKEAKEGFSHAEMLAPMVQNALKETAINLDAIALSEGPGSYTGLRIGTSFAKGLCYSLDIPLISINTLKLIAKAGILNTKEKYDCIISMIDARRDEVYLQTFTPDLKQVNSSTNLILESNSLNDLTLTSTLITGSGSKKAEKILHKNKEIHYLHEINPLAEQMCEFSIEKYKNKDFEDLAYFEPYYLKPFFTTQKKKEKT